MKRNTKNPSLALLVAILLVLAAAVVSLSTLHAQSPQSSGTDKPPATITPAAAPSAGMVWINTDTGVYHKQGTRWYGKTKHGEYILEADAV